MPSVGGPGGSQERSRALFCAPASKGMALMVVPAAAALLSGLPAFGGGGKDDDAVVSICLPVAAAVPGTDSFAAVRAVRVAALSASCEREGRGATGGGGLGMAMIGCCSMEKSGEMGAGRAGREPCADVAVRRMTTEVSLRSAPPGVPSAGGGVFMDGAVLLAGLAALASGAARVTLSVVLARKRTASGRGGSVGGGRLPGWPPMWVCDDSTTGCAPVWPVTAEPASPLAAAVEGGGGGICEIIAARAGGGGRAGGGPCACACVCA